LGATVPIERIVYYDRAHNPDWVVGGKISILDEKRNQAWEKTIDQKLDRHNNRIEF